MSIGEGNSAILECGVGEATATDYRRGAENAENGNGRNGATAARCLFATSSGMLFHPAAQDCGGVFADGAVPRAEGGEEMAVNIQLSDNSPFDEDGADDFGFGFQREGQLARVVTDVPKIAGPAGRRS